MRRGLVAGLGVATLLAVGGVGFAVGTVRTPGSMSVRRVTAEQVGDAMQGDHFFSDFRLNTLLMTATVRSSSQADEKATFVTTSPITVSCTFAAGSAVPAAGSTVTVVTVAARAVREPHGVRLVDCVVA